MFGNLKPHKNLERLLEAFSKLKKNEDCILLLVGKAFESYNVLNEKEEKLGIKGKVLHTGIVSDSELIDLYNLVDLFVFPSLYEGFGLPVIEAMRCGTKVVSSNASSLPEVGGNVIHYFNPKDIDEMSRVIEKELERINTEKDIKQRIEWSKNFDWKNTVDEVKKVFSSYK